MTFWEAAGNEVPSREVVMPVNDSLDFLPLWFFFIGTFFTMLLAFEGGFRLGRLRHGRAVEEKETPVGAMVASELALLGFLLAFTYSFAASRFDDRKHQLLDEANAVGTAYLRADLLPEPHRSNVRRLLREYVEVRITAVESKSIEEGVRRSEELHKLLWAEAVAVSEKDPRSVPFGLYVQSLNEVIDLHTKRLTAGLRNRIPIPVWTVLFGVATLSFAAMGYHSGLTGTRRSPAVLVVALTFAAVIWLVADLDRPIQGWLHISQQTMIDLRNSMEPPKK